MNHDIDVVVVGAGIHGAGAAQAAAAAGYSVLVLEQYDIPAQGTSSKSSKLIHGGLRYLESGEFHLVHECLRERANLLHNVPHLVKLVPFQIPVYKQTTRRPWKIAIGLAIYSLFSFKSFNRVPRNQWHHLDSLKTKDLDAVFNYYDAQTDDAHLTRSVLASAQSLSAEVITGAQFKSARLVDEGCEVYFRKSGDNEDRDTKISARVLINAAGPWVNDVLDCIDPKLEQMEIELVQGAHIVLPGKVSHPYYLESPKDKRAVFVMPWKGQVLVGTTENDYQGHPSKVKPLESEIDYLLEIYNHYFERELKPDDVIDAFAGLRVLPGGSGEIFKKSRDTHFETDRNNKPRVLTIYGGKLTSYRATSEKVVARIKKSLPARKRVSNTRRLKLPVID
jgi:glycerol-3-phosphate dehydrogenase